MVVYNIKDNSFDRVTEYRGPEASVVADNSLVIASDLQNVTVFDLDRNIAPIKQIKLGDEETLAQSDCGMQGPVPDLFVSEFGSRMFYGVYKDVEVTDCNARPQVEIREIVLD